MNRRVFLALLPLPWLGKVLPEARRCVPDSAWQEWDAWLRDAPKPMAESTFVCRNPEGVLLLRANDYIRDERGNVVEWGP